MHGDPFAHICKTGEQVLPFLRTQRAVLKKRRSGHDRFEFAEELVSHERLAPFLKAQTYYPAAGAGTGSNEGGDKHAGIEDNSQDDQ